MIIKSIQSICKIGILLILLSLSQHVLAQTHAFLGTIVDEKGKHITGATITNEKGDLVFFSDSEGNFSFRNANAQVIVKVSYIGYKTQLFTLTSGKHANITLVEDINKLDEVFVTGTFDKRTRMNASVAISTLDESLIENQVLTSAADLLKNVPGVFVNSSLGEIRNSVASRGITAGTQDGSFGYEYVSMQEDNLPVTNTTYVNYGPDFFLRPDATLFRLEAVRGGTASIAAANAPGGIFNYISKTGGKTVESEIRLKYGLMDGSGHSYARVDANTGGPIANNWYYNVGGFYRYDQSGRFAGYPLNNGGQSKANIVKEYATGKLKFLFKYLNDKNGYVQFMPTTNYSNPKPANGFDINSSVLMPRVDYTSPNFIHGGELNFNPSNLVKSDYRSAGLNWEQNLGDGWKFQNALRFSKNNILYNTPSTITTISATDYVSYYLLTGLEGLGVGNYSYKNVNTGEEVMNVSSAIGSNGLPVYTVNNNNLPGQDLLENGLFAIIFGSYQNKVNEIVEQFTIQKTTDNMTYTIGGYYGYSDVDRYSGIDGIALGTIQNRPELLSLTFTGTTLGGTTGEHMVTNADGIGQANGDNGTSLNFKASQKQMALFFGHTWNIDDEFTFDWGFRYENVGVSGQNERAYMKTGVQGGVDGNPNTFYDYNTVDRITSVSFDRRLHSFSFSGALNYMLNENWALYGRYSQGQKAPDLDVYFAANREETIGLLNPQKRTTRQVEMGLKARSEKINLFVTPFYSILSGVPNSQFLSSEDGGFYTPEMLYGKYRTVGVELEMEYSLNSQLSIRGIATFQRSKIVTLESWAGNNPGPDDDTKISFSGNETDNTPRAIINISPTYSLNKWFTSATWSYLGQRQANVGNVFVLPGFSQFNLSAGYGFNEKINLSLNVNNIFNNYGVMSWVRPGGILEVIEGNNSFTSEQYEQAVSNSTPFSTISIQPRAIYLTTTIKF